MNASRWTSIAAGSMAVVLLTACNEDTDIAQANATQATASQVSAKKTPREVCTETTVTRQKPVKDKDRVLGTIAGAVVGGVVGMKWAARAPARTWPPSVAPQLRLRGQPRAEKRAEGQYGRGHRDDLPHRLRIDAVQAWMSINDSVISSATVMIFAAALT